MIIIICLEIYNLQKNATWLIDGCSEKLACINGNVTVSAANLTCPIGSSCQSEECVCIPGYVPNNGEFMKKKVTPGHCLSWNNPGKSGTNILLVECTLN